MNVFVCPIVILLVLTCLLVLVYIGDMEKENLHHIGCIT